MKRLSLACLLLLCLCFVPGAALAQSVVGALVGQVTDPSGAAVSNAKVSVRNVGTNQVVEGATTKDGAYTVTNLQPADYDVTITAPGFATATIARVHLLVSASVRNDVKLTLGSAESKIEVSASPAAITTDDATIGDIIEGTAIARLPLNGRTIDRALVFVAGNTNDNPDNPQIGGGLHWNGAMYNVDGVPVNDISNGAAAYSYDSNLTTLPSTELIQEIKVVSSVAKAEFEGGTAISMTTKSGSNKFHGEAYYFNRNRFGAARDYFAYAATVVKPGLNRNEYGGFISGPIWKDKTFFLFAVDNLIQRNGKPNFFTVPTDAERSGDFSANTKQLWNAATGTIIPGNKITNIDPRAAALLAYVPHANIASSGTSASGGPTNNLLQTVNNKYDDYKYTGKLDHNLNRLNALTAEGYYAYGNPYFSRNGTPAQYGNYQNAGYITVEGMLRDVSVFSPSMLNEIHYSYFSHRNIRLGENASFDPTTLFPGLYGPFRIGGLSTINMTNYTSVGDTGGAGHNPETTQSVADNFTLVRGRHTFKFGASVNFNNVIIKSGTTSSSLGTFGFTGRFTASAPGTATSSPTYNATGDAFADFLLGDPNSTVRATPQIAINQTYQNYEFYGQDDWAITPRLTLNLGLRYEVQTSPNEQNGDFSNFDFTNGKLVIRSSGGQISKDANATVLALYPGTYTTSEADGWGSSVMVTDKTDFGPRFGFAYRVTGDAKTVVRGGYGIYYGVIPPGIGPIRISQLNFPFLLTQSYTSTSAYAPTLTLANPFPGTGTVAANPTIYASQRDAKQAHIQQWNLTLEQALPASAGFRLSYVGNKTTHAPFYVFDMNYPRVQAPLSSLQAGRPYQPWASILTNLAEGYAFTNQMQAELTKRTGNGLYLQASYTWASGLDNVPISGTTQNPYKIGGDKGNSDGTRKNNFFLQATYELPFQRHGFGERVVNGWSLASLTQLRSGTPFSPSFTIPSTTTNASGGVAVGTSTVGWYATRPNKITGADPYDLHSQHGRYFDGAAFAVPDNFTFGNAGRNSLIGPPEVGFDLSMEKKTKVYEGAQFLLRLDAFNVLNHPNFGNPAANISNTSTVGLITATNSNQPNRSLQLGGKLVF